MLISGVLEADAYGDDPARGVLFGVLTGIAYAGFLLVLRHGNEDLRRPAGPLCDATAVAAAVSLAVGLALGVDDLAPAWPSAAWLATLALTSQVLGWLLISVSLPRLPAALTSMILTVQPVGSVLLGIVLLGESPSELQLAGAALILAGLVSLAGGRQGESRSARQPPSARAGSGCGRAAGSGGPPRTRSRRAGAGSRPSTAGAGSRPRRASGPRARPRAPRATRGRGSRCPAARPTRRAGCRAGGSAK